jgi:hypothetical protein
VGKSSNERGPAIADADKAQMEKAQMSNARDGSVTSHPTGSGIAPMDAWAEKTAFSVRPSVLWRVVWIQIAERPEMKGFQLFVFVLIAQHLRRIGPGQRRRKPLRPVSDPEGR